MHCFSTANIGCLDAQGLVWCATWGGISCFDGQHFTNYTVDDGLPHNHIHAVYCDSRDHLWFASEVGVIHYDGHTFQTVRTPHTDSTLSIIEDANDHSMLFSTRNHVVRYSREMSRSSLSPTTASVSTPPTMRKSSVYLNG
jgi:ligand-binding sensor domain-containing protein